MNPSLPPSLSLLQRIYKFLLFFFSVVMQCVDFYCYKFFFLLTNIHLIKEKIRNRPLEKFNTHVDTKSLTTEKFSQPQFRLPFLFATFSLHHSLLFCFFLLYIFYSPILLFSLKTFRGRILQNTACPGYNANLHRW